MNPNDQTRMRTPAQKYPMIAVYWKCRVSDKSSEGWGSGVSVSGRPTAAVFVVFRSRREPPRFENSRNIENEHQPIFSGHLRSFPRKPEQNDAAVIRFCGVRASVVATFVDDPLLSLSPTL
jgi:hypothetical protein